jgi:dsDNA-specific endonuclease/ATPase MutS2
MINYGRLISLKHSMLKSGDKIKIRENSEEFVFGEVVEILRGGQVKILLEDGFEIISAADEVMKVNLDELNPWFKGKSAGGKKHDQISKAATNTLFVSISRNVAEVDIHIEQIVPITRGLSADRMIDLQLEFTKNAVDKAIGMHLHKIILIHGEGKGKLRGTIRSYLHKHHPKCEVINADKMKYGDGATEVILHY